MNSLEINMTKKNDEIVLTCTGRLDANRAGYLNDYIDRLVREGHYFISLDLSEVEYLSSAGIRILVSQYKNLDAVNGHFTIRDMSENVRQVLNMVGIADMLSQQAGKTKTAKEDEEDQNRLEAYGFVFTRKSLSPNGSTDIELFGNPELTFKGGFRAEHARTVKAGVNHFSVGLGAIGVSFDECKNRFGEFIILGKNAAYLPGDGSGKPDYMVATGQLVVSLTELYGLHFTGNFSYLIRFDPVNPSQTIGLSQFIKIVMQMTDYDQMALVMIAESGGLIGTSLNASPVEGKELFTFPEIKENINFTTEPAHNKMLTLSAGYISSKKDGEDKKFIRPLLPDESLYGHIHSSVFPFVPLKKTDIDLNETIGYIFNNTEIVDILHLTNDIREITGQGESQFVKGFCWVVPVESINFLSK
jgi:anti-anti-sigma factor